jgi:hypothetical protein
MFYSNLTPRAISPFNVGLALTAIDKSKLDVLFQQELNQFVTDLGLSRSSLQELKFELSFTDKEFNKKVSDDSEESFVNKFFYPIVFSEIKKGQFSKIDFKARFTFTLDSSITTETTISGIKYGHILLGQQPVMYYIHIDIQRIIDLLKS